MHIAAICETARQKLIKLYTFNKTWDTSHDHDEIAGWRASKQ